MAVLMKAKSLLSELEYDYSDGAVQDIYNTWMTAKANLINHFRKHPNWDEEQKAIIFSQDFERRINTEGIKTFKIWGGNILRKRKESTRITKINGRDYKFYTYLVNNIDNIEKKIEDMNYYTYNLYGGEKQDIRINGNKADEYIKYLKDEVKRYKEVAENYKIDGEGLVRRKEYDDFYDFGVIMDAVSDSETSFVDEKLYNVIMNRIDVKIAVGMKVSKAVQKVCQYYGLDKVVEMGIITRNGIEQEKDYGYKYQYALFSDSINTVKVKRHTVISVNMLDYWLMSNGHKWSSCHNADKRHILQHNGDYDGCYSGGTESYMLDKSTVIFYTVDEAYAGEDFYHEQKMQRCNFHIAEDGSIIIQGRVYPDGRDGGDQSYAKQFREVVQKIVSECWKINNQWINKKGTEECERYTESEGVHYRDYERYDDCNVSINKEVYDGETLVYIGTEYIICPQCGESHDNESNILCEDCAERWNEPYARCDRCGDAIDEDDDYIYCEENGCYYCCESCANNDGVHYCVNDYEWHTENNCYEDNYSSEWYYGEPEIITEDGYKYAFKGYAERDGYIYEEFANVWVAEDECYQDSYTEEIFHPDYTSYIVVKDKYYLNAENAEKDGYVFDEEADEWREVA